MLAMSSSSMVRVVTRPSIADLSIGSPIEMAWLSAAVLPEETFCASALVLLSGSAKTAADRAPENAIAILNPPLPKGAFFVLCGAENDIIRADCIVDYPKKRNFVTSLLLV